VSSRRLLFLAAALVGAAFVRPTALHAQTDIIRGRITAPDSLPVERARITVTSISGNVSRSAQTDKNGRFTVAFPGDEGDYFVTINALGFASKRFEVKRTGDQDVLIADARLSRVATQLDAVKVQADRQKVARGDAAPDISGSERNINANGVPASQLGDLAALAASLPGVQLIPNADGTNGFSVLGLTADQNATTLNGMNFGGSNLPRDANVSTSLVTAPYDVSRGNFSGGLLNVRAGRASNFIIRSNSLNVDAPQMQWTDAAARALGQQYTNLSLGGSLAGPIQPDKSFFTFAYQGGRRLSDLQSLLNTDPLGLQTIGISTDSVNHLLSTLRRWNLPTSVGAPSSRFNDQALVFSSVDFTPPTSVTGQAFNLTMSGSWNRQDPSGFSNTELPSHSGERNNWNLGLFGRHSSYFGFGVLSETSIGVNETRLTSSPFVDLPNASVRVNSSFADGTPSVQTIAFGGNPAMNVGVTQTSAQFSNALSWFSENNKHRIKYTTDLRRDQYAQDLTTNQLGTFAFNSLTDLDAGRPAIFSRQLTPRKRSEGVYIAGLSLGDSYRPSDDLQVQYGVRLDGNKFSAEPLYNSDVDRLFSARNDRVPNKAYVSPRIGFSWTYGTNQQIGGFDGAVRGPRAVLRGGIGVFQNTPNASTIGSAMDNTGLSTGAQQLVCVGSAAPSPDWAAYMANLGAVPTQCANGAASTVFASTAPNVTMFDQNYQAPRAIRSNLNWSGSVLDNRFRLNADVTYSLNENQPGNYDLNFNPALGFSLANEANRPVFAQAANIVTTTGSIAANEGRVSPLYSHVTQLRSDLRSETKQFTVNVAPMAFNTTFTWSLAYVYQNSREEYRGFSSTGGDPRDLAWSRSGFDSRHQVQYRFSYNAFDFIRLGWNGSFRSGNPYTPVVATDINGDGYANDRAFVFNPAATTDTALANGMRALLTNGSGSARDCLARQLGSIATRTSCQGPWYSTANLTFSFNPLKVRLPQRANLTFQISNPLGAADLLMHGDNRLHGWGQSAFPQNQLLYVRGFDAATRQYKYEVNPRFGATSITTSASRLPVTLTAMMRIDVGPTFERQMLTQMLDRGRTLNGQKMPEVALKAYGSVGVINPMAQILRQADTLQLTSQQADSIAVLNRLYTIKLDSLWSPVAKFLAGLPDRYDQGEAYERYRLARETSVDALIKAAPAVKGLLTDAQMRMLPTFITPFLDARYLASIRSGTAGSNLGMMMMPGGAAAMGAAMGAGMGGGGGMQVIIKSGTP
jgi:hypothetical protein